MSSDAILSVGGFLVSVCGLALSAGRWTYLLLPCAIAGGLLFF